MRRGRWRDRSDSLSRTRLTAVGIGGVALLAQVGMLGNPLHSAAYTGLAGGCIVAIVLVMALTYLRGRPSWWTVPLIPVLIAVGGGGLQDPVAGMALAMGSTVFLSLYGSTPMWLLRVAGAMIAVPSALAISPESAGRTITWHSPTVAAVVPQLLLMAVLMRGIYLAVVGHERTAKREAALARAGHAMIGRTDLDTVREIGRQVAEELVALAPGTVLLVLRRDAGGFRIANLAGVPDEWRGRRLAVEPDGSPSGLATLLPDVTRWRVDPLGVDLPAAEMCIAVGGRRPVRADVLDAFRTLSHQVVLAEQSCRVYAELDHLAHHDHLTELPTRAKFFRTLSDALVHPAAGTVALLTIDLDEFKQVNDRYGHAAGDELLLTVAARLAEEASGRGLAGRFGGDEFAMLLTEVNGTDAVLEVARRLSARLTEPIRLTAATVTVGASIGVAVAEPDVTVNELTRRADVAMYAAKGAGKNRVETFPPTTAARTAGPAVPAGRPGGATQ